MGIGAKVVVEEALVDEEEEEEEEEIVVDMIRRLALLHVGEWRSLTSVGQRASLYRCLGIS
jgi:hypothetical protein